MSSVTLKPREERRLTRGHLWAYRNELSKMPELGDGELVDVFSADRRFVGRGFYQAEGGIAVRLVSRRQEDIDRAFLAARIACARELRERCFGDSGVWRWIHAESDGLPGLVADRYERLVTLRTTCAFYIQRLEELAGLFLEQDGVAGVCLLDGPEIRVFGDVPDRVDVLIEGLQTGFSLNSAQKTGLYLDQRLNRVAIEPFAAGARVLDGHCYVGQWSCHAARSGAVSVLGADTSAWAVEEANANAARNGLNSICQFENAAIEDILDRDEKYGLIILDPPAFAKARSKVESAQSRYMGLNANAIRRLAPGGFLATSSCSHFIDARGFTEILKRAAATAKRQMALIELRGAAPDHSSLLSMPETAYLKCAILRATP